MVRSIERRVIKRDGKINIKVLPFKQRWNEKCFDDFSERHDFKSVYPIISPSLIILIGCSVYRINSRGYMRPTHRSRSIKLKYEMQATLTIILSVLN